MKKKGWTKIRKTRQMDGWQRVAWYDRLLARVVKPFGFCLAYRGNYAWLVSHKEEGQMKDRSMFYLKCSLGGLAIMAAVAVWAIAVMLLEGW